MGISYEESMKKFEAENARNQTRTKLMFTNNSMVVAADEQGVTDSKYKYYSVYADTVSATIDSQKNVNLSANQIVITQESNSQYIKFRMPRSYDGVDLPGKNGEDITLWIHFENGSGQRGRRAPINVYYEEDHIVFGWLLDLYVTAASGRIRFEIRAEGSVPGTGVGDRIDYQWKSRINDSITVLESLDGNLDLPDEEDSDHPSVIAAKVEELEDRVEDLEFVPITIATFRHNKSSQIEIGSELTGTVLSWKLSRATTEECTMTLSTTKSSGNVISTITVQPGASEGTIPIDGVISDTITWGLAITDEKGTVSKTASAKITFLNAVYYGPAPEPSEYNDEFIEAVGNSGRSELTSTISRTLNFSGADDDSYYWYCAPCRLGGCSFMTGGYQGGMGYVTRIEFANDKGFKEWYDIYRNGRLGVDSLNVVVTGGGNHEHG